MGVPSWAKRTALVVAGMVAVLVVVERTFDYKRWLRSQLTIPHGRGGRIAARAMPLFHKVMYGPAAELLDLDPDDVLLDVACGSGVFLDQHANQVQHVAGIDLSEIQINMARRRLRNRITAGTAEIVHADGTHLPWGDNTFTAASCVGSLEYMNDPESSLREMHRVLQSGGRIVVTYGIDDSDEQCVKETEWWGLPHPSEAEARKLIEKAGFSMVTVSYLDEGYLARFLQGTKPT